MIKVTARSQYGASFECVYKDEAAEDAFDKVIELQDNDWEDVKYCHLDGLNLDRYYKKYLCELSTNFITLSGINHDILKEAEDNIEKTSKSVSFITWTELKQFIKRIFK